MGGWSATDGDPATSWVTPFGPVGGATLTIPLAAGQVLDPAGTELTMVQPAQGTFNTIAEVTVRGDAGEQVAAVPAPDSTGTSMFEVTGLTGSTLHITITGTTDITTTDRRYAEQVLLPAAITELSAAGIVATPLPEMIPATCHTDLVGIDGTSVGIRISGSVAELFAGEAADTRLCDAPTLALGAGEHVVRSAAGLRTGIAIDRIVLRSAAARTGSATTTATPAGTATVTANGRIERTITVGPCPQGCWFVFGEGYNKGWTATAEGRSLGIQRQVDGGFNGWYLPPSNVARTIELTWDGQTRLTIGIALSGFGLLVCIALIVFDRRRVDPPLVQLPGFVAARIPAADANPFAMRGAAAATTFAAGVVGALVIAPAWGLLCAAIAALCGFGLRRTRLLAPIAVAMVAVIVALLLRRFLILKPFANAGWPGYFEDLHRPGMAAIVLLAVSVIGSDRHAPANQLPQSPRQK